MEKTNINNNLLFNQNHFELLINLNRISFDNNYSLEDIYNINTEALVEGLFIDRASLWRIEQDKMVCINLFDKNSNFHYKSDEILTRDLPIYIKALNDGIAIVADDVMTNKYTQELKDSYFIPLGITDLLDLPIRENGKVTGVLCCEHRQDERTWNESDLAFARCIADHLVLMVEHKKRSNIEKELIDTERKLSLITDNSTDGFLVFENRKLTYVSQSYLKMMGYTEEEALQTPLEVIFDKMHPDDVEQIKSVIYFNLNEKNKNFKYAFRFKNKSGNYFWQEHTASVLYDSDHELYSKYMIISRDITPIKSAEDTIEKLYTITKNQNEKIVDFTHIISHNIRSNTSNISMIIDLIADMVDSSEKEEYFQLLKESNNKLSETIHYLNETINVQLSKKNQKININLKSQIDKTLSGINGIIKNKYINVNINVPDNIEIYTIPTYLESIIFNLVTNAIKYQSPDRKLEITITAQKTDSKVTVEVMDNGLGINMERNKDKIFGMYKTFHGNEDAVGLGLFITKNHVGTLGGEISVKSEVGIGSTFKFILND